MLSVIIPTYKDPFLKKTIDSLLANVEGDVEIIAVIDGELSGEEINHPKVKILRNQVPRGVREGFNDGLRAAQGEYIMKCDSHCAFGPQFDRITKEMENNWIVVPRAYSLDELSWTKNDSRPITDYYYMCFPTNTKFGYGMWAGSWPSRNIDRKQYQIDDILTFPETCWVANRNYFMEKVGFMDTEKYGKFAGTQQEIGLKYWLNGGEMKVNKNTWYGHLRKRQRHYDKGIFVREYKHTQETINKHTWSAKHWINDEEPGMLHPFSWIVEKFWPIPTWPDNWREIWRSYNL